MIKVRKLAQANQISQKFNIIIIVFWNALEEANIINYNPIVNYPLLREMSFLEMNFFSLKYLQFFL